MDSMNEIDYKNLKAVSDTDRVSNHICRKTSIEDIYAERRYFHNNSAFYAQ